jgi:hypothetical protein
MLPQPFEERLLNSQRHARPLRSTMLASRFLPQLEQALTGGNQGL